LEDKYKSIFDNITDEEFENILKECGFKYEKVEKGKGGLFIDGKRITVEDMEKVSLFNQSNSQYKNNLYWYEDLKVWDKVRNDTGCSFSNYNNNIDNLKQAIRHIKKHKELVKGTRLLLSSNFVGYEIEIIV